MTRNPIKKEFQKEKSLIYIYRMIWRQVIRTIAVIMGIIGIILVPWLESGTTVTAFSRSSALGEEIEGIDFIKHDQEISTNLPSINLCKMLDTNNG